MVEIIRSSITDIRKGELSYLLGRQSYFPYDYLREITKEQFVAYLLHGIEKKCLMGSLLLTAWENNKLMGLLVLQELKWDSEIFGFGCARISYFFALPSEQEFAVKDCLLEKSLEYAREKNISFIDINVHPLDFSTLDVLSKYHFHLIGTHIHHVWDFRKYFSLEREANTSIRIAHQNDVGILEKLSADFIPKHNRFLLDEKLRKTNRVPIMFREWLKNSVLGRAQCVLLAEIENQVVGYTTIVVDSSSRETLGIVIANVELTGVLPHSRNKGILRDMITTAVKWAHSNKIDILEGVVHVSNAPANIVPPELKSRVLGAHHTFHWHAE